MFVALFLVFVLLLLFHCFLVVAPAFLAIPAIVVLVLAHAPLTAPENFHVFTINQVDTTLGMGWCGDGVGSVNVRLRLQTKLMLHWGWGGVC